MVIPPWRWSLRRRLVLAVAGAVALAVGWLTWWHLAELRPRAWQTMEESLVDAAAMAAAAVAPHLAPPDAAAIAQWWRSAHGMTPRADIHGAVKERFALDLSVTDARGIVVWDSARPWDAGRDNSAWNDVGRTLQRRYGARATRDDPDDPASTVLHVAAPILRDGRLIGVATVAKPIGTAEPFIATATVRAVAAALVAALAAAVAFAAVTWWITRPLGRLHAFARRAAAGAREPLPPLGRGEVAELGAALLRMRDELDGRAGIESYVQALVHELKSPLTGIRAAAELLAEDLDPEERRRFAQHLRDGTARLHDLADRLLRLAAAERLDAPATMRAIDLAALAAAAADAIAVEAEARRVTVAVHGTGTARGDAELIALALSNVLRNAVQHAPAGSTVDLTLGPGSITVADCGPGFPGWALPRLGTRFFALERPDGSKGTGIGLALARAVARLHGGHLELAARDGGGARVRLHLGVHAASAQRP